jgi:multidrug efflux pump
MRTSGRSGSSGVCAVSSVSARAAAWAAASASPALAGVVSEASGAGAEARQSIGVVIFYGVTVSVVLTLAVVPAVYTLVARNTQSPQTIARLIDRLRGTAATVAPRVEAAASASDQG